MTLEKVRSGAGAATNSATGALIVSRWNAGIPQPEIKALNHMQPVRHVTVNVPSP